MTTRIILTVWDAEKRPYMGTFDFDKSFHPRTYENGSLKEEEHEFLIELACVVPKVWFPMDHKYPPDCIPVCIWEAVWAQLEAGMRSYYKFTFNPPLETQYAEEISEHGLAHI